MAKMPNALFLIILSALLANLTDPCVALYEDRKVYIVYMGALPTLSEDQYLPQSHHLSILQNVVEGSLAEDCLIYSYKRSFNGFAAFLTDQEQQKIASIEGVVSVFPSKNQELHTTRSWDFLGFSNIVKRIPAVESNVIVGIIDSGIWPESESFSDEGFSPPPKKWKGICQTDGNFTCNKKLIGARYYKDPLSTEELTARDTEGHGTHTASTVAGREVKGVSLFGIAKGNARGAVPSARIAVYKVCNSQGCPASSILAAFDDAIADGVDILSASIGGSATEFYVDPFAIGAFHAMKKSILTLQSGGNSGPDARTIGSVAPWIFTVAASTTDRLLVTKAIMGDGTTVLGRAINTFNSTDMIPLIHGQNASTNCNLEDARICSSGCLDKRLVKGKIIFCEEFNQGDESLLADAKGQITEDTRLNDVSFAYPLPSTLLNPSSGGDKVKSYIRTSKEPQAKILKTEVIRDLKAPVVASFSSRGPNPISANILKPDITAPGVDILAAFSPAASFTSVIKDKRSVKYNIESGTSMACPHVSGAVAYVKTFHPQWSPAALKSALMTTALPMNSNENSEVEFAFGAGQINPVKAINPGLVYDTQKDDYIPFLCNSGYNAQEISLITGDNVTCSKVANRTSTDLNYPSMALQVLSNQNFTTKFSRSVTNVGSSISRYKATVNKIPQLQITVKPSVLSFKLLNEKQSFVVIVAGRGLPVKAIVSTSLLWSDGVHSVRSPIVVYTREFEAV